MYKKISWEKKVFKMPLVVKLGCTESQYSAFSNVDDLQWYMMLLFEFVVHECACPGMHSTESVLSSSVQHYIHCFLNRAGAIPVESGESPFNHKDIEM